MRKNIAFIFARGGSKGLPGKNLKMLQGKPLIYYSIELARQSQFVNDVVVSTDSPEIANVAKELGATVPFLRPAELAQDNSPEIEAWRHGVNYYRENIGSFDTFISLPTVSPVRRVKDLEALVHKLYESDADFAFTAVKSDANPYFNLIEETDNSFYNLCKAGNISRRQEAKQVYKIIPMMYACQPDTVFKFNNLFSGKVTMVEVPLERAIDIDSQEDFDYLKYLVEHKGLDLCTK